MQLDDRNHAVLYVAAMGWLRDWKRKRVLERHALDERMWQRALARLPFLAGLSQDESARLKALAIVFLAEKEFTPVRGALLSEDDRLSIALQACLPVLELGLGCYDGWVGIIVHPADFRVQRAETDEDGVVHVWDDELAGESWPGGPVVLSWDALGEAGSVAHGGVNVVIHEFTHMIDMADGEADGVPPLASRAAREAWIEVFDREFDRFCDRVEARKPSTLDPYAAEHESEFFAVASEAFFESPRLLKQEFPELYRLFRDFYRQDPAKRLR
jgi:Mlc titration factor MtfA (ptsG expression regulator)